MRYFHKILVANRGEIAVRILRTCRELGISTVAIYSEADRGAPHARAADEAVCIGPAPSGESYLVMDRIIETALNMNVDAVHPGYGFLSENATFAQRCADAKLAFIGPSPDSIRQMGSKIAARKRMAEHGVPVIPGYDGPDQRVETLVARGTELGFPLLIKASAGGGGKGMRIVREPMQLEPSIASARREALGAFGDDTLLLERYIESPRHVEFQILGDQHGHLIHLFERECSIQRRHQKILEESPSPVMTGELRERMAHAAVTAGMAIGYFNAGTVEFIVDEARNFFFLEVNTRLQVEHPVTELVTGLDLVRLQIEIAQGAPLPLRQEEVRQHGHAVEARIYAEDATNGFLPATGSLVDWSLPPMPGIRLDSGVETGTEIGIHYDPMLAKLIAHGSTREIANRRLARALREFSIQGVTTNREMLIRTLEHPIYQEGAIHTHFIETWLPPDSRQMVPHPDRLPISAAVATLYDILRRKKERKLLPDVAPGYRNNRWKDSTIRLRIDQEDVEVAYRHVEGDRYRLLMGFVPMEVWVLEHDATSLRLEINGVQRVFRVIEAGGRLYLHGAMGSLSVDFLPRFPEKDVEVDPGAALSPMPGRVLRVHVRAGERVSPGAPLVTLEAMKMEHTLRASLAGVVERLTAEEGALVQAGEQLVHIRTDE